MTQKMERVLKGRTLEQHLNGLIPLLDHRLEALNPDGLYEGYGMGEVITGVIVFTRQLEPSEVSKYQNEIVKASEVVFDGRVLHKITSVPHKNATKKLFRNLTKRAVQIGTVGAIRP